MLHVGNLPNVPCSCSVQIRLWEEQPSSNLSEIHDAAAAHLAEGVRACSVGAVRRADRLLARLEAAAASAGPEQLVRVSAGCTTSTTAQSGIEVQ